ncbi:MAG: hypothetical protein WD407_11590 [Rhodospirillales bacterium]
MTALTKEAITRVLGPIDNALAAEIAKASANEEELCEAYSWLFNDEALINNIRPLPKGRVAELVELLRSFEISSDEEGR